MRESIKKRIDDLDIFFEDNFDDEFISYFERGRYKLKKLIQYEPNLINEINNGINMKAFVLSPNSKDNFFEQNSDINNNINHSLKKNKNISKSCKMFTGDNLFKNNKSKMIDTNNDKNIIKKNMKYNFKERKNKWQKEINNRIYNNYYNKDIRKKYTDMDSEDSGANNKIKYMDWTENNSVQGNTLSVKSNKINDNTNPNINPKRKSNKNKLKDDDFITINFLDESITQSSKNPKNKNERKQREFNVDPKDISNKEILFEIKLNKEEYEMFLEQKNKKTKKVKKSKKK